MTNKVLPKKKNLWGTHDYMKIFKLYLENQLSLGLTKQLI